MNRAVLIGIAGVAAIVLAIGLSYVLDRPEDDSLKKETEAPPSPSEIRSEADKPPESNDTRRVDTEKEVSEAKAGADTSNSEEPSDGPVVPTFDVVRINPQGDAVIAGRAEPGAEVTVLDGGESVGSVTADKNGEWVLVPSKPLPPGDRQLSIVSELEGGDTRKSEDVVVLSVPEKPVLEEKPLAVLVPREGMETKKILQTPSRSTSRPPDGLTLDVVDYDANGNLRLSGHAGAGSEVVVYLDNSTIGSAGSGSDGGWELRPAEQVAPGLYTLRVDEIRERKVVARIELPFSRAAPLTEFTGEAFVVVQPGNSLWRIARSVLGKGLMYSVIYDANKKQIRDPDLIYPGQVFAVPRTN